jgi:hypothetical protein
MKKSLVMWMLASTMLQVAILVWLHGVCPALFWVLIVLSAATISAFIYFLRILCS